MQSQGFFPRNIEYFERDFLDNMKGVVEASGVNVKSLGSLRLYRVRGLPKFWGERKEDSISIKHVTEDLVSGLFESRVPLFFSAFGGVGGLEIAYGTFTDDESTLDNKAETLKACLGSSFHGLEISPLEESYLSSMLTGLSYTGILTGVPSLREAEGRIEFANVDRLMRGVSGKGCGLAVVSVPMGNEDINSLFNMALNEIKIIMDAEKHSGQESPTGKQYKALLEKYLERLQRSKSQGLWFSSFFIFAEKPEMLDQVKALTKSAYSGKESVTDRIRVLQVRGRGLNPGLIMNPAPASPGQFKWPYMYSNILGTSEIASMVQMPGQEFPGYKITPYVKFNVSKDEGDGINIGEILDQGKPLGFNYKVPVKGLKKHGLIEMFRNKCRSGKKHGFLIQKNVPLL